VVRHLIVLLVEIAEVTPPVGFNLFVLQNMTARTATPLPGLRCRFFGCLILCIAIVTVFPEIVTWLPNQVMGKEK
jgi:TRAP-type C4-dicarboxylate transport system permease large subunit